MKWILNLFFFLAPLPIFALIVPIHSITHLETGLDEEKQTLVVFDIDDTLTILSEPAFQGPNFKIQYPHIFTRIMDSLSPKERFLVFTLPLLASPSDLIEAQSPGFIDSLHKKRIKTIALTAAPSGKIEGVSVEDKRIEELRRFGIDFSSSFPDLGEVVLAEYGTPDQGIFPLYKNGVILTNNTDKGEVLVQFLKTSPWKPDEILFVDDRLSHISDVEKALKQSFPDIAFKGFHFKTDKVSYTHTDAESFTNKWMEMVEISKEIIARENQEIGQQTR